jgi:hypothetical protein
VTTRTEEEETTEDETEDEESSSGGQELDVDAIVSAVVEQVSAKVIESANQVADKRINQVLDRLSKPEKPKVEGEKPAEASTEGEVRLARKLLKRAIRDEIRDTLEPDLQEAGRELAGEIAGRMILTVDDDEDELAVDIVKRVAGILAKSRDQAEGRVRDDLKKRGLLKDEDPEGSGQPPSKEGTGGAKKPTDRDLFKKGEEVAKKRFGGKDS